MNSYLMYKDRDFRSKDTLKPYEEDLIRDLELETIYEIASQGDETIQKVFKTTTLNILTDKNDILYRQRAIKDAISNKESIKSIYKLSQKGIEEEKRVFFGFFRKYPDVILHSSIRRIEISIKYIKSIMQELNNPSNNFTSQAFCSLIKRFDENFDEAFLTTLQHYLKKLRSTKKTIIQFSLSNDLNLSEPILLKETNKKKDWIKNIFHKRKKDFSYCIDSKDECSERILLEIKNMGIGKVADTLSKTANHLRDFLNIFYTELAFYKGAIQLQEELKKLDCDISFPLMTEKFDTKEEFKNLKDISLLLTTKEKVVSNDLKADGKELFIITGSNKGGKTSYIRALTTAQILAQCGLFVTAKECKINICQNIFTHFKKSEDKELKSGKFDEELKRLSLIIDNITPDSLIVFNESFASTNEAEASLIAYDIVKALLEKGIKIFFVTHMYSFAKKLYQQNRADFIFLRANRKQNGQRDYKITPLPHFLQAMRMIYIKRYLKLSV